ncbi:MAG: LysM domain-containing protein, partial [Chloroflexota bacterium]
GDSLSSIAREFGTSVNALVEANGIEDPDRIVNGQTLIIP